MARYLHGLAALAVGVVVLVAPVSALPKDQRFRSGTAAVVVDVLVTDGRRPIRGLGASDFVLRDSGIPQRVSVVATEQMPLAAVVTFDTSGSVRGQQFRTFVGAARRLMASLKPDDSIEVLSFSSRVRAVPLPREHDTEIDRTLFQFVAEGRTALRDAVFAGLLLPNSTDRSRLIVVFSDGVDTASVIRREALTTLAKQCDDVIYAVVRRLSTGQTRPGILSDLATSTGGRMVEVDAESDAAAAFERILAEFRERYVLTYEPQGVGGSGWHDIEVSVRGGRARKIIARSGYLAK